MVHAKDCKFEAFVKRVAEIMDAFGDTEIIINDHAITVTDAPTGEDARLDINCCPSCGVKTRS